MECSNISLASGIVICLGDGKGGGEGFFFGTNPSFCWYLDNRAAKDAYQWFLAYAERHVPKRRKGLNKSLECNLRQKRFWVPILCEYQSF